MEQLFMRCDETGIIHQNTSLVVGDDAKITQGPFDGVVAKIIEFDPNQRVNLLLEFMGQTSTLTIDTTSVVPIA